MKQHNADYQVVPYPKHRRAEAVLYRSVQRKPMIHGLIEGDVTRARAFLRDSSCGCLEGIHRCRRSTVERWAYRQWACLGKGQVGASLQQPNTLMITVGGIGVKPGVVDGHITIREYLSLTVSFDHDMIDGAPAARFTQQLIDLIESGYGLDVSTVASEQAGARGVSRES